MNETTPNEVGRMLYERWRLIVDTTAAPTTGWPGMREEYRSAWIRLAMSIVKPREPEAPPAIEPLNTAALDTA